MTVATGEIKSSQHTGDGVEDTFPISFKWWKKADIVVTVDGVIISDSLWAAAFADGTAFGSSNIQSWVVFTTPPDAASAVVLTQVLTVTQETDYSPFGSFKAESHEGALDKMTILLQNAVLAIGTETRTSSTTPSGTPYGTITHDGSGNYTVQEGSYVAGSLSVSDNGQILYHGLGITELDPTAGTFSADSGIWENQATLIARYNHVPS
jgi:hypothetical protein